MRRMVLFIACLSLALGSLGAQAAQPADGTQAGLGQSDMYPVRVDVTRVLAHAQGYRVVYRKGEASFAEAYVPSSWFVPGGKAVMLKGRGPQYPYMVVYYKSDGSFSHLKLYVLADMKDPSWGVIEGDPGDRFKVESVKLEF